MRELDPRLHLSQLVQSRLPHSSPQTATHSMSGSETLHAGSALGISSESLSYLILLAFGNLPTALRYFSFSCRIIAFAIAAPFALCIALDLIAYGIARTLHLSLSPRRVPRSPSASTYHLASPHHLLDDVNSDMILDDASTSEGDQSEDSFRTRDKMGSDGSRRVSVASFSTGENTSQSGQSGQPGALALDGIADNAAPSDWEPLENKQNVSTPTNEKAVAPYPSPSPSPEHGPRFRLHRHDP